MPARQREAVFCTPGRRGLRDGECHVWARGLRGAVPRVDKYRGGGLQPPEPQGREGPAEGVCQPSPAEEAGKARQNTPFPARPGALRWANAARGHPRPRTGVPSGPAPRRPPPTRGSPRPGRACPAAPPARRPARRRPHAGPRRAGRGGLGRTDTAEGPAYLGGCWWLGSFPGGRGASGRGRGVQAQREKGGGGRPRPRQVAGWRKRCRRTGGSSGGSSDCSCGSLRIFLGQVQDGGAPCTGFPVTLAMGRTTKEARGEENARAAGGARKRVAGPRPTSHAPSSALPSGLVAPPPRPAPLAVAPVGAEESASAQAPSRARRRGKLLRRFAWSLLKYDWVSKGWGCCFVDFLLFLMPANTAYWTLVLHWPQC
ncbi:translation initiation factor IF-2-like [Mustela putorius furo]|uniref:Translation initiation factor IF-2-like n=1 Tax=Mustela putorius furo TaxID=9669 RepID=A0A8U0V343_MUSPF|nr:translation initiation factor IF-2-like [Mustela putorius furo]XP_044938270.1 translation initiation factor IF-2-like [Mustela putorius furo]XP_044938271.1 translation initiation factor IF-2-like [Mustela putorius furo]